MCLYICVHVCVLKYKKHFYFSEMWSLLSLTLTPNVCLRFRTAPPAVTSGPTATMGSVNTTTDSVRPSLDPVRNPDFHIDDDV